MKKKSLACYSILEVNNLKGKIVSQKHSEGSGNVNLDTLNEGV
jgi:hypothetical protein